MCIYIWVLVKYYISYIRIIVIVINQILDILNAEKSFVCFNNIFIKLFLGEIIAEKKKRNQGATLVFQIYSYMPTHNTSSYHIYVSRIK